jgi:chromosomal replication initiation ATPase DnaA
VEEKGGVTMPLTMRSYKQVERMGLKAMADEICALYHVKVELVFSSCRETIVCLARDEVFWRLRHSIDPSGLCVISYASLARRLGVYHPTVLRACKRFEARGKERGRLRVTFKAANLKSPRYFIPPVNQRG